MTMEFAIGANECMSNLYGMDVFINKEATSQQEEDV